MTTEQELKELVKQKYGEIASQDTQANRQSCCGSGGCSTEVYNIMTDDYTGMQGYQPDADLGLGCGLPTQFAQIKPGNTVVDLGSGAGNDCFVARAETGETGRVIGIDFTPAMLQRARQNASLRGFTNVEFIEGDIEHIPLPENTADVVVSNCVLNLVPNKQAVFAEIYRILKPGGHFSISDIVLTGQLPAALRHDAEMYAGCVSGAISLEAYVGQAALTGFTELTIQKKKAIELPTDILAKYLTADEIAVFGQGGQGIYSITLFGKKPMAAPCCAPGSGCC